MQRRCFDEAEGDHRTCVVTSAYGESRPHVQHQVFAARTQTGGHLTYCLLQMLSGRCEADYLLWQLIKNAKRFERDPVMPDGELMHFLRAG